MAKPVKNLMGLEWKEPMTAGRNHWYSAKVTIIVRILVDKGQNVAAIEVCNSPPQICLYAEVMNIGLSAPRVPIIGNSRVCDALALVDLLKRAKSGMLTARLEKRPMTTLSACRADHTRPTFGLISVGPWTSGPPPLVTITALREKSQPRTRKLELKMCSYPKEKRTEWSMCQNSLCR